MTINFKSAVRANVPLLIGLDGASGSGKTYSAHKLAKGIAEEIGKAQGRPGRVFGIDTERGRMLHYADEFDFMHGEIGPPFRPAAYADALDIAEHEGADVVIIDSFSHEWEGEGGVREWADEILAANQNMKSPAQWKDPKLAHKRLVNKMLAMRPHIIVCLRSEEKMRMEQVPQFERDGVTPKMWNGKQSMKTVITPASELSVTERWVPICEKRFPFEITTSLLLTPDQPGVPIPRKLQRQHRPFFPVDRPIGEESGRLLARWSLGAPAGEEPKPRDFSVDLQRLEEIARPGNLDALADAWQKIGADARKALASHLPRLKEAAAPRFDEPEPEPQQQPQPQGAASDGYDGV